MVSGRLPSRCLALAMALPVWGCSAFFTVEDALDDEDASAPPDASSSALDGSIDGSAPPTPDAAGGGADAGDVRILTVTVTTDVGGQIVLTNYEPAGTFCNFSMPCQVEVPFGQPMKLLASPNTRFAGYVIPDACPSTTQGTFSESATVSMLENCEVMASFVAE